MGRERTGFVVDFEEVAIGLECMNQLGVHTSTEAPYILIVESVHDIVRAFLCLKYQFGNNFRSLRYNPTAQHNPSNRRHRTLDICRGRTIR